MDQAQVDWMLALAGKAPALQAAVQAQNNKSALLDAAWSALEAEVAEIRVGEDFAMEMRRSGLRGFLRRTFLAGPRTMPALSADGPDEEFDTGHDLSGAAGLSAEQATALTRAHALVVAKVDALRRERGADGKPLFTDGEIAKAVWEPLMRRKLVPENAVPDRYSEVSSTFQGASEQYEVRLEQFTKTVSKAEGLAVRLGIASETVKNAGSAANGAMTALTAAVPAMKDFPVTEARDICMAVTLLTTASTDVTAALVKEKGLTPKAVEGIANTVVAAATGWVTAGFSIANPGTAAGDLTGKMLGKAINGGLQAGLAGTVFAAKVATGDPDKIKEAFIEVGNMVEQCCICAGGVQADREGRTTDAPVTIIGRRIKQGLLGAQALAVLITASKSADPTKATAEAIQNLVKAAIDEGARTYALERQTDRRHGDKDALAAADQADGSDAAKAEHAEAYRDRRAYDIGVNTYTDLNAILASAAAIGGTPVLSGTAPLAPNALDLTSMIKLAQRMDRAQLDTFFKDYLKGNAEAQALMTAIADKRDKELATAGAGMAAEMADDTERFRGLLSGSEAMATDDDVESIEVLILQLKKDQMVIKLAESLAGMLPAAVAAILPPAMAAVDAVQLVVAMRKALAHMDAWLDWSENVVDARSAMSLQAAAMANRAGLSQRQALRESANAVEKAIKLVGDVFATGGGPFAHAGMAVSQGIVGASALKDVILKIYDERKLQTGWDRYQAALADPADRKAIRKAVRSNPTLAKYVIAYGAVVAGHPVAKNALQKCGLNAKVLQSPGTNAQKVVAYLEALYADDPVLLRRMPDPPDWHPGPVALSAASIAAFSYAGQKAARPALAAPVNPELAKSVLSLEAAREQLSKARLAWEQAGAVMPPDEAAAALDVFLTALHRVSRRAGAVLGTIAAWRPEGTDGKPHTEGRAYQALLERIAESQRRAAQKALDAYGGAPA